MSLAPGARAVVIDGGSGFTKCGYSGNIAPDHVFPTAIAAADEGASDIGGSARDGLRDLDFVVGEAAVDSKKHSVNYPIRHGLVENWTNMERLWQRCFFDYLRCDPEEAYVVLVRGRRRRMPGGAGAELGGLAAGDGLLLLRHAGVAGASVILPVHMCMYCKCHVILHVLEH